MSSDDLKIDQQHVGDTMPTGDTAEDSPRSSLDSTAPEAIGGQSTANLPKHYFISPSFIGTTLVSLTISDMWNVAKNYQRHLV